MVAQGGVPSMPFQEEKLLRFQYRGEEFCAGLDLPGLRGAHVVARDDSSTRQQSFYTGSQVFFLVL